MHYANTIVVLLYNIISGLKCSKHIYNCMVDNVNEDELGTEKNKGVIVGIICEYKSEEIYIWQKANSFFKST